MSDWTIDTLREATVRELDGLKADIDKRFAAQQKEVETAFNAAKEAVIKSEIGVEKRSDAVYVSLSKLGDAMGAVMPRSEAEQRFKALSDKIGELKTNSDTAVGKTQGTDITIGKIYAAVGVVGAILGIIVLLANGIF